jgi:hypothetical protein
MAVAFNFAHSQTRRVPSPFITRNGEIRELRIYSCSSLKSSGRHISESAFPIAKILIASPHQ